MAPRTALSDDQISDFRDRLVAAATTLFARRGFDGVTLRAIASELGCSPMTPYRYFEDKAAIFAAVRAAAYNDFAEAQEACCVDDAQPMQVLADLGRAYVQYAIDHPDNYRLMFELSQPNPERFPELQDAAQRSWRPLHGAVARAIESGAMAGEADVLAHVFWCGVHGVASLHLAGKLIFGCSIDDVLIPVLRTLFMGNRGDPEQEGAL